MDITHKLKIIASADQVYKAMATQKGISGWWSKDCKVGEKEGEKSLLKFDKQGTIVEMGFKTDVLKPNERVAWTCTENANPAWLGTTVELKMRGAGDGVEAVFTHGNFDEKWKGQEAFEMTKGGWDHFVKSLVSYCEKGEGQPW